ncbi:MAG: hypothetical protein CL912_26320 [Deltaproteobacteria bacterium]|nr:hypothetical protein [Deltaproteobacteria bacterium]|tara:strand:- start:180 stop:482 length:303 start_codon:yes stop_codon:yes gene_type:complete
MSTRAEYPTISSLDANPFVVSVPAETVEALSGAALDRISKKHIDVFGPMRMAGPITESILNDLQFENFRWPMVQGNRNWPYGEVSKISVPTELLRRHSRE